MCCSRTEGGGVEDIGSLPEIILTSLHANWSRKREKPARELKSEGWIRLEKAWSCVSSHSQGYFAGGCLVNPPSSSVKKEGQKSGSSFFPSNFTYRRKAVLAIKKRIPNKTHKTQFDYYISKDVWIWRNEPKSERGKTGFRTTGSKKCKWKKLIINELKKSLEMLTILYQTD